MPQIFSNNSLATLATGGVTNVATTITVTTGQGALFPAVTGTDYMLATLDDGTNVEVVKITAHTASSDSFTVVRAQEAIGTTAATGYAFAAGAKFEARITAGTLGEPSEQGFTIQTADVGTPATGNGHLFMRSYANRGFLSVDADTTANPTRLQPSLFTNSFLLYTPGIAAVQGHTAGYAMSTGATAPWTVTGTITHPAITTTNRQTMTRRTKITTPAATAGSTSAMQLTTTADFIAFRGNVAKVGGFFMFCRFFIDVATAGGRLFIGFQSTAATTPLFTTADPLAAASLQAVGLYANAADTVLKFGSKDGTTIATHATTGTATSKTTANRLMDFYMYAKANDSTVSWRLDDLTNDTTTGDLTHSSNLPAATTLLRPSINYGNGSTASSASISVCRFYIETDI